MQLWNCSAHSSLVTAAQRLVTRHFVARRYRAEIWKPAGDARRAFGAVLCRRAETAFRPPPVIDRDDASWAGRLVRHLTLRMLKSSEMFTHETLYDEMSKRLLRHLKAKGRVTHGDLLRASHLDKDTFKTVVATMAEAGQIREEVAKVGRTGQVQRTYVFETE